jgi:BirA family biotin operon repressor/biotin-[acetyl-CoA-carboxylase] ligase
LYAGRKVAGVLAQACLDANNTLIGVVVGFGVNVRWCPEDAARLGDDVTPHELLHRILIEYDTLAALSDEAFHELYKANLSTLGSRVRVDLPTGESVTGTAVDVAPDGELKIVDACALTHLISAGDVVHLRVVN